MNRYARALLGVAVLGMLLSVGWTPGQVRKGDMKDKKKDHVGRQIIVTVPTCFPTNNGDNAIDTTMAYVTSGTNDSGYPVYGVIIDPDSPDTPINGTTDATLDGSNSTQAQGKWQITFGAGTLAVKNGYVLRVIDSNSGNSQDCVFNVVLPSTASTVVSPIPPPETCTVTAFAKDKNGKTTTTTRKIARIRTKINAFNPKFAHGELFNKSTKTTYYGGRTYMLHDKKTRDSTEVVIEVDITGIASGTVLSARVHSYLPHGNSMVDWTVP